MASRGSSRFSAMRRLMHWVPLGYFPALPPWWHLTYSDSAWSTISHGLRFSMYARSSSCSWRDGYMWNPRLKGFSLVSTGVRGVSRATVAGATGALAFSRSHSTAPIPRWVVLPRRSEDLPPVVVRVRRHQDQLAALLDRLVYG